MRHQYRVTKYDPILRDTGGAFTAEQWTSYSDIGHSFLGVVLSKTAYLEVETAYLTALSAFLTEGNITRLTPSSLENTAASRPPAYVHPGAALSIAESVDFARLALRGVAWGKLVVPGRVYVHFGWDYYMYIGLSTMCPNAVALAESQGLYVERYRSPYLRRRTVLPRHDGTQPR